tara:strand:- start:999 stop:1331 length:333 start_codon:yes stop_codon:yes gene_type:complete
VSAAEWYKIGETDKGNFYLDIDRIRSDSNYTYYWEMVDLKNRTDNGNLSILRYIKADCSVIRYQTLQYVIYDGNMGSGEKQMQDSTVKDWKYFAPGAIGEKILEKACKLK